MKAPKTIPRSPAVRFGLLLLMLYLAVRRSIPWRAIAVILPLVFALQGVKDTYRAVAWGPEGRTEEDFIGKGRFFLDLSAAVWSDADEELVRVSLEKLVHRVNYLAIFSYVVEMTPDQVPYWMGSTYTPLLSRPIPRILYPDKPREDHGQAFGHRYGIIASDDLVTSINMAQLVEMYANFGVAGVLGGMFLLGVLYSGLTHIFNHRRLGDLGIVFGAFIFSQLTQIEANFSGLFGGLFYIVPSVYVLRAILSPHGLPWTIPRERLVRTS